MSSASPDGTRIAPPTLQTATDAQGVMWAITAPSGWVAYNDPSNDKGWIQTTGHAATVLWKNSSIWALSPKTPFHWWEWVGAATPKAPWRDTGSTIEPGTIVPPPPPPPPPPQGLTATLDFGGGKVAHFSMASAVDKGTLDTEFWHQHDFLATDPTYPGWSVRFRPEITGTRNEVVVEQVGQNFLTPIVLTVFNNGASIGTETSPRHWDCGRWRWQSATRALMRTPALLKQRGWIANFGMDGMYGRALTMPPVAYPGPMQLPSGFNNAMAATGDDDRIGLLTEAAALYVITGDPGALTTLLTEAEWTASWPTHFRTAAGDMLDVRGGKLKYVSDGGTVRDPIGVDASTNPSYVAVEGAHMYPTALLAWLLTDDPFYAEEVGFTINTRLLYNQYHRTLQNLQGIFYPGQTREFAWGIRDASILAAAAPDVPNSKSMLPRSYYKACLDDNLVFALRYVNSPAKVHKRFSGWTRTDMIASWQNAWLTTVVGQAVKMGFMEWKPVFDWSVKLQMAMSDGKSGWDKRWFAPYYAMPNKVAVDAASGGTGSGLILDTSMDAQFVDSYDEWWTFFCSGSLGQSTVIDTTAWDSHARLDTSTGTSYMRHVRAALAEAVTLDTPGAQECYDWVHSELRDYVMPKLLNVGQARFSVDPVFIQVGNPPTNPTPAWSVGQAVASWREIAGSAMSLCPQTVSPPGGFNVGAKMDAWGGHCYDTRTSEAHAPATGGHVDWFGNQYDRINYEADAPVWIEALPSDLPTIPSDSARYNTGNPASCHPYWSLQYIERRNRAMRFGAPAVANSGNTKLAVEGYNTTVATGVNGWDPAGTYPDLPGFGTDIPTVKDTLTEDVYIFNGNIDVYKWTQTTNTIASVFNRHNQSIFPPNVAAASIAHDSSRHRIFLCGGSYTGFFDTTTGDFTAITLTGPYVANVKIDRCGLLYEPVLDLYLFRDPLAGGQVYSIHPTTWATGLYVTTAGSSLPATVTGTGGTAGGPYNRWVYFPRLKGCMYTPKYSANSWFLRTQA